MVYNPGHEAPAQATYRGPVGTRMDLWGSVRLTEGVLDEKHMHSVFQANLHNFEWGIVSTWHVRYWAGRHRAAAQSGCIAGGFPVDHGSQFRLRFRLVQAGVSVYYLVGLIGAVCLS
jgi:hypothetical protein